jgi:hypothetical protein
LLISSQNVDTRLYSSKRLAYFSVSLGTLFWFVFYFHILVKVNLQEFSPSSVYCFYDYSIAYSDFVSYSSFITISFFSLTMIILLILAFKNVRRIRAVPRQQQRNQIRSMTRKDFQLLRCLYVHDIVYIICSLFLNMYYVYGTATTDQVRTPLGEAIYLFIFNLLSFLHHIPYCASFLIFLGASKSFRCEMKRMMHKIVCKEVELNREKDDANLNVVVSTIVVPK